MMNDNKYKKRNERTKYKLSDYLGLVAVMGMIFLLVMCAIPIIANWIELIKAYWTL